MKNKLEIIQKKYNVQKKNMKDQYEIRLKNYQKEKSRLNAIINNLKIEIKSLNNLINEKKKQIIKKILVIKVKKKKILIGKIIRN